MYRCLLDTSWHVIQWEQNIPQLSECVNSQGRVLMWDVEGSEGWVDGRIQGYCRSIDNVPGKLTCALAVTEGAH